MNQDSQSQALGRIEGKLDMMLENQKRQDNKLQEMDTRLRNVEVKAATTGALAGALASVCTSVGVAIAKAKLGF
ncbi:hypothetical protein [Ralstonia solanacearum]|uniref:hypothetical protein n=1 Tax=Ralstonia solanacearum TaxID=305 RepID=UPI0005ACD5BF|nr:hypothetical protein [Ralstonia solanacearum]QNT25355.1 hypothetical protein C2I38_25175 [Ralstonia solanacearum]QNT63002.1 hypothetical protein C2L97_25220 [Ralstonia solanacearum]